MKHTLLFVDDEADVLQALRRLFARDGHEILTATSGEQGLQLLADHSASLIISNMRMPDMDGAEFLTRSRALAPEAVRMVLTGRADLEEAQKAINQGGVHRYITKPWDFSQLKATVDEALERHALEQTNRRLTRELQEKNAQLEALNAELESRVEERTAEVRKAYEENLALTRRMELKVRELEGRDRIAQHLLGIHDLDDTLALITRILSEVLDLDRATVYLCEGLSFRPRASTAAVSGPPGAARRRAFQSVRESRQPLRASEASDRGISSFAVVPILAEGELLGLIDASRTDGHREIDEGELHILSSFALQVAIAIGDAHVHQNVEKWQERLDDILRDDELDQLIG